MNLRFYQFLNSLADSLNVTWRNNSDAYPIRGMSAYVANKDKSTDYYKIYTIFRPNGKTSVRLEVHSLSKLDKFIEFDTSWADNEEVRILIQPYVKLHVPNKVLSVAVQSFDVLVSQIELAARVKKIL